MLPNQHLPHHPQMSHPILSKLAPKVPHNHSHHLCPKPPSENHDFCNRLTQWYSLQDTPPKPHILLGDHNLVKDAANHLPPPDPPPATTALLNLRIKLQLSNGWRQANPPPEHRYMFAQPGNGSRSRIDRIYAMENIISRASDWSIENPEVPTDHQLITVKIYNENSPQIGCSCWTMKPFLLKDKKFLREIENTRLEKTMDTLNNPNPSPQTTLQDLITHIWTTGQLTTKIKIGRINTKVSKLEKAHNKLESRANSLEGEAQKSSLETISQITSRILETQSATFDLNQNVTKVNKHLYGKLVNKYWCANRKERKGCDTIMELCLSESTPNQYSSNSIIGMFRVAKTQTKHKQNRGKTDPQF